MQIIALLCVATLAGCATPVSVRRVNPRSVHRMLTESVLSNGQLSGFTQNTLRRWNLFARYGAEPDAALAELHGIVTAGKGDAEEIFALSELSFYHAERIRSRQHYLAAAVYAYAYLFPEGEGRGPGEFDPRQRLACDLYNRALTEGFASDDGEEVALKGGVYALPFGDLQVEFNERSLTWIDRKLSKFTPVAELEVQGLTNRYRRPGIGAPLAASTTLSTQTAGGLNGFVSKDLKASVTALLRIGDARGQLGRSRVRATLELHTDAETVTIGGRRVPLEAEPTAAYAAMLVDTRFWEQEIKGFLNGNFFKGKFLPHEETRLTALHPYQPGRIPVVLVHGTASSPGRWGDLVNELENDPRLRDRIQIWLFTYDTGYPVAYSAMLLRQSLQEIVKRLERDGEDPALRQMVLVGHSQGGLLCKLSAVDSGNKLWAAISQKPFESVKLNKQTRELLGKSYFVKPLPFVRRVVYVATPHQGSFMATQRVAKFLSRFVKLPTDALKVSGDVAKGNIYDVVFTATHRMPTAVDDMSPGQPFSKALASLSVAPGVAQHSIIAVKGDGPKEKGNDGVVKYASAHVAGAESEVVVNSGHSCQSNPAVIDEVRRILVLETEEE